MKKYLLIMLFLITGFIFIINVQAETSSVKYYKETYINPEYINEITEADLVKPSKKSDVPVDYANTIYKSFSEAAAGLRAEYVKRTKEITITVQTAETIPAGSSAPKYVSELAMVHTGVPTEGDYIYRQYGGWTCSYSTSKIGNETKYTITYTVTYYTTKAQEDVMNTEIAKVLKELNLDGKTDYQKVKAIYDYITSHVTYDYNNLSNDAYKLKHTAYAALINGTSVCQGFAVLFYRLALENGIDARYVNGYGNGGRHGWNIVKLGNYYYNLDATWDAGVSSNYYRYFLKSMDNFGNHTRGNGKATTTTGEIVQNDYDFTSAEFNAKYPMSPTDYNDNSIAKYKVTYMFNDSVVYTDEVEEGSLATNRTMPKRSGYTFAGWTLNDELFDFTTPITGNITLIARYDPLIFNVIYAYDGVILFTEQVEIGKQAINKPMPKREGYTFEGWTLNGVLYNFATPISSDIVLTAKYTLLTVIEGDINQDGRVDLTDILVILKGFFAKSQDSKFDINNDGVVDLTDVLRVLKIYFAK